MGWLSDGGSGSGGGSLAGFSALPSGWAVGVNGGEFQVTYNGNVVQSSNLSGTLLATSVQTGTGSFHLGALHSIGSAGENVAFVNNGTGVSWFPVWQGTNIAGTADYSPSARYYQTALTSVQDNGAAIPANSVNAAYTYTAAANISFYSLQYIPAQTYTGNVIWTATFVTSGIVCATYTISTGCTSGVALNIPFQYPLEMRTGDAITITLTQADGVTPLLVQGGTTNTANPYRLVGVRTWVDSPVMHQNNISGGINYSNNQFGLAITAGGGVKLDGNNSLVVDATNLDVTTLKNASTLQLGTFKGTFVSTTALSTFANAAKGSFWICSATSSFTLGGQTFNPNDQIWASGTTPATIASPIITTSANNLDYVPSTIVNATASAPGMVQLAQDLTGSATAPKVAGLQGVAVASTAPTDGQVLTYSASSSNWLPKSVTGLSPATATPLVNTINGTVGTSALYARQDHQHPAPLVPIAKMYANYDSFATIQHNTLTIVPLNTWAAFSDSTFFTNNGDGGIKVNQACLIHISGNLTLDWGSLTTGNANLAARRTLIVTCGSTTLGSNSQYGYPGITDFAGMTFSTVHQASVGDIIYLKAFQYLTVPVYCRVSSGFGCDLSVTYLGGGTTS